MRLALLATALVFLSCDLFSPREAQPPDNKVIDCFIEPIVSDYITANLECSLTNKSLTDYLANLSTAYRFYFDQAIDNTINSELTFIQEENVMTKVFEFSDTLNINLFDSTTIYKDALVEHTKWHYQGFLAVSDTTYNIAGTMELELILQQQYWVISKWNDLHDATTDSTEAVTFGSLKDKFSSGALP